MLDFMIAFIKVTKLSELQFDSSVIVAIGDGYMVFRVEYLLVIILSVNIDEFTAKLS